MDFRIADTFQDSLGRLTGDEQKAAKTTAFDLQLNPANPGMSFHKLDKAKDKNFWSVRVNADIRLIVHRTPESLLLCYVDHHDAAYRWAERRKLQTHPKTGAAQLVVVRETVQDIVVPRYVEKEQPAPPKPQPLAGVSEEDLLGYGVPPEWIHDVQQADEDRLLQLADLLPKEAAEALLDLAVGVKPPVAQPVPAGVDPFEHPDAQRRFRVMKDVEELRQALEYPWEKWMVFLHPAQKRLVERAYSGPARVTGSAGTGKTIVAIHRAAFLARQHRDARLLLTTFSEPLAQSLQMKLKSLAGSEPGVLERIEVGAIHDVGNRLYASRFGRSDLADEALQRKLLQDVAGKIDHAFTPRFLWTEWHEVVDAWRLTSWEAYRDVPRLGRKTRLGEKQRQTLWSIFAAMRERLAADGLLTHSSVLQSVADDIAKAGASPYDHAIVDEAQDLGVSELRLLSAIAGNRPDGLFFAGDLGQRIFQPPFSWRMLGVDVRGRSQTLRINYRTSHQIRQQADRLLPPELSDVDGNSESRRGTISVFNGPEPRILRATDEDGEIAEVATVIREQITSGLKPEEIGIFVRSGAEVPRALAAINQAGQEAADLSSGLQAFRNRVAVGTMHLAKGLEFKSVVVMACDEDVLPLQDRVETITDEADLDEVYATERHLLYVACTRARDQLTLSCVGPGSEFLGDLRFGVLLRVRD